MVKSKQDCEILKEINFIAEEREHYSTYPCVGFDYFSEIDFEKDKGYLKKRIEAYLKENGLDWGNISEKRRVIMEQVKLLTIERNPNYLNEYIKYLERESRLDYERIAELSEEMRKLENDKVGERILLWFGVGIVLYIFLPYTIPFYLSFLIFLFWVIVLTYILKDT